VQTWSLRVAVIVEWQLPFVSTLPFFKQKDENKRNTPNISTINSHVIKSSFQYRDPQIYGNATMNTLKRVNQKFTNNFSGFSASKKFWQPPWTKLFTTFFSRKILAYCRKYARETA